ncbi:MAG: DUF5615 family PIN-like protein [Ignavibacteria bacterium]|nr:DUF5615 family PIN-like protein [Ignavibacteria bacterium]
MKLLFDANISYRIVKKVIDVFPASEHVNKAELENKKDITIWNYAKHNGFSIVTFDEDFNELSILKGTLRKLSG